MELVHEKSFIERLNIIVERRLVISDSFTDCQNLKVTEFKLRFAVVSFDDVLIRERSSVQLKIKLARICIGVNGIVFYLFHIIAHKDMLRFRAAVEILTAARRLYHLKLRTAASVSVAVGDNTLVGDSFVLDADILFARHAGDIGHQILGIRPDMCAVEVSEHLSPVNALPIESVYRESVGVVPVDFGGEEIVNAAALHNLRYGGTVTESVGQPEAV